MNCLYNILCWIFVNGDEWSCPRVVSFMVCCKIVIQFDVKLSPLKASFSSGMFNIKMGSFQVIMAVSILTCSNDLDDLGVPLLWRNTQTHWCVCRWGVCPWTFTTIPKWSLLLGIPLPLCLVWCKMSLKELVIGMAWYWVYHIINFW